MKTHWSPISYSYTEGEYPLGLRGTGTIPTMFFIDPGAFFRAYEGGKFVGTEAHHQAWDVYRRARGVRLPEGHSGKWVQYLLGPTGKFIGLTVAYPNRLNTSPLMTPYLDLSFPRTLPGYDKAGEQALLRDLKRIFIGKYPYPIAHGRAEEFFDDDARFVFAGAPPEKSTY